MAELLSTDEFLVNRNDVTYTQEQETLMATLQDTDHLLINRAGQTYKITGEDLINSVIDPLEVTVILAPTEGYTDTEVTAVPVVSGGKQPDGGFVFTYQWVTATDGAGTNKANIAGANNATFTPDSAQVGQYLGCVVGTTDALGTSAEGEAYIGPIQVLAQAPVIADIAISEIYDGQNRFTDKEFPYVTTMAVDGEPDPTYEVKAKLSGTTFDFDVLSDVITDVEGGGIKTCETDTIESVEEINYVTNSVESEGSAESGKGVDKAFDGILSAPNILYPSSGWVTITFDPAIDVPNGTQAYLWVTNGHSSSPTTTTHRVNGNDFTFNVTPDPSLNQPCTKVEITSAVIGNKITSISCNKVSGQAGGGIGGIQIGDRVVGASSYTLTFPTSNGFDCFEPGDVVQSDWDAKC